MFFKDLRYHSYSIRNTQAKSARKRKTSARSKKERTVKQQALHNAIDAAMEKSAASRNIAGAASAGHAWIKPRVGRDRIRFATFPRVRRIAFLAQKAGLIVLGTAILFHLGLALFTFDASIVLSFVNPPVTSLMAERAIVRHYANKPVLYVPLSRLPAWVSSMYIRVEDKNFYTHQGIDLGAMKYAYEQNERFGRIVAGGSTITQQLVRTLFLVPYRAYPRKYAEVLMSVILDAVMSKHRILELYLNYIEWGKGVYGIGAAVQYQYHKRIDYLTREEFCRLAAIIVNPIDYDVNNFFQHPSILLRYYALLGVDPSPVVPPLQEGETPPEPSPAPAPMTAPTIAPTTAPASAKPVG